jgi:signal transduction histidine kinase
VHGRTSRRVVLEDDLPLVGAEDAPRRARRYLLVVQAVLERIRARAFEALVLTFAVASVVEVVATKGLHNRALIVAAALGWSLPFLARRRYPFWAPLTVCVTLSALAIFSPLLITDRLTTPFVAALSAAVAFGLTRERSHAAAGWAAIVATGALFEFEANAHPSDFFWTTLIFTLAWFIGAALGTRTEQARELQERVEIAERDRANAAVRAAYDERARIARELHDVVAHSVSVMVVQASGVRRLLQDDQEREREALLSVEQIGRQALSEMRRMVGVMRTAGDERADLAPQPGLDHLDRLIAQVEEAGLPVSLRIEGERPQLTPGVDLSAYRIVQEGLTNALKHAKGAHAEVLVRYEGSTVKLEVSDDGSAEPNGDGQGHGLVGMRERVALYGGTLDAGPRAGGGFLLRAELPVEGHA